MQAIKEAEIEDLRKKLRTERQESEPNSSIMPYTDLMKEDLDMWIHTTYPKERCP